MNDKILTIKKSTLVDIANQVRAKTGLTDLIKVADLDDAVAELSGGGVVDIDVLPKPTNVIKEVIPASTYTVDEEGNWTRTSEPASCNKIYFNTSLSVEETITEIKKVTQDFDAAYGKLVSGSYMLEFCNDNGDCLCEIEINNNVNYDEEDNPIYSDNWEIKYYENTTGNSTVLFNSEMGGWNPMFNGEINSPAGATEILAYVSWLYEAFDDDPYKNIGIVNLNSEIVNLVYTGEEVPNSEFNAEPIYKLPDETMWMWSDDKFIRLGEKLSPMELGTANNPEFGFYYGQIFSLDDPITFDIPVLVEEMNKLSLTNFNLFNNTAMLIRIPSHDTYGHYLNLNELKVDCTMNQENGEMSVRLYNNEYSSNFKLDYTYIVSFTENFTFTIRQLYKDSYANNLDSPMSPELVDGMLKCFPLKFGIIEPSASSVNLNSGSNNWWTQGDLNNPDNAIFKFLKIGK